MLRTLLLTAPVLVVLLLVQAYFWVPKYDAQSRGNPARAEQFIEALRGDAEILNPVLLADAASSRVSRLVFDGLLDLDENLALRGRLATWWSTSERVYIMVASNPQQAQHAERASRRLVTRLKTFAAENPGSILGRSLQRVISHPAQTIVPELQLDSGDMFTTEVMIPPRVELRMSRVEAELQHDLDKVLGADYANTVKYRQWLSAAIASEDRIAALRRQWPVIERNPVIEFRLRDDVYFHDGHKFDASDVLFTYHAIMDPKNLSPRTADFEPIKHIESLSPHHIEVTYKRLFSSAVNAWTMGILPEHLLNPEVLRREFGDAADLSMRNSVFNRSPIGTGAFKFVRWDSDEVIELRRNPSYWDGAPGFHKYYFRIMPDVLAQEMELRAGSVDAYAPEPHQVARYRSDPRYQLISYPQFSYAYIGYNLRRKPFDDARVRRALGLAIDIQPIIDYVLYGEGRAVSGPYPWNTRWSDPTIKSLPYDPKQAQQLLAEAGWLPNSQGFLERDGKLLEFNLITNNGNPVRKAILTIVQDSWRKIGIKVNTEVFEWAVFLKDFINPAEFDAVVLGWKMSNDPDLYQIWHSSQIGPNQLNFVGYASQEADALLESIRREYDLRHQQQLTHELHHRIALDQPYTFLYSRLASHVFDKKIIQIDNDGIRPIQVPQSGDLFFNFNHWNRLEIEPNFH